MDERAREDARREVARQARSRCLAAGCTDRASNEKWVPRIPARAHPALLEGSGPGGNPCRLRPFWPGEGEAEHGMDGTHVPAAGRYPGQDARQSLGLEAILPVLLCVQ